MSSTSEGLRPSRVELLGEISDLVLGKREPERRGSRARAPRADRARIDERERARRMLEELRLARRLREQRLGHAVVEQRRDSGYLVALEPCRRLASSRTRPRSMRCTGHAADVRDVGRFRGPRRDRAEPRHDIEVRACGRRCSRRRRAVFEQRLEHGRSRAPSAVSRCTIMHEMRADLATAPTLAASCSRSFCKRKAVSAAGPASCSIVMGQIGVAKAEKARS